MRAMFSGDESVWRKGDDGYFYLKYPPAELGGGYSSTVNKDKNGSAAKVPINTLETVRATQNPDGSMNVFARNTQSAETSDPVAEQQKKAIRDKKAVFLDDNGDLKKSLTPDEKLKYGQLNSQLDATHDAPGTGYQKMTPNTWLAGRFNTSTLGKNFAALMKYSADYGTTKDGGYSYNPKNGTWTVKGTKKQQSAPKAAQAGYKIGEIQGGFRYDGGDPTKQENWIKAQ
jgi:hypothetical protein